MTSTTPESPLVDKARLDRFLSDLADAWKKQGVVYLVGGSAMVAEGHKHSSRDIDLGFDVTDEQAFYEVARAVADRGRYLLDLAPDPTRRSMIETPDWRKRSLPYGRFGSIEVRYWNAEDIVLNKVSRGTQEDWDDIESILRRTPTARSSLEGRFQEMYTASRPSDEKRMFRERFQLFLQDFGPRLSP